jgi:hypothetical protein
MQRPCQWINDGLFFGFPDDKDPLVGPNDGSGQFTIPQRPIRRRLTDLPGFVVNRGSVGRFGRLRATYSRRSMGSREGVSRPAPSIEISGTTSSATPRFSQGTAIG